VIEEKQYSESLVLHRGSDTFFNDQMLRNSPHASAKKPLINGSDRDSPSQLLRRGKERDHQVAAATDPENLRRFG
jgi:hypothetical protein